MPAQAHRRRGRPRPTGLREARPPPPPTRARRAAPPRRIASPQAKAFVLLATLCSLPIGVEDSAIQELAGRLVAVGISGASAVSAVGTFHPGGPIHDKPAFCAFTQPGSILDPLRILVASSSNFGAPLAGPEKLSGAILSIDPRG